MSATISDRLSAEFAPAWRPNPGDELIGEVVSLGERDGLYGAYPIVTVRRENGDELAVHAFHSVLARELAKHEPQIGETLGILYAGRKDTGDGKSYHGYRVVADRPSATLAWSQYRDPADQPKQPEADFPVEMPPAVAHEADDDVDSDDIPF